MKYINHTLLLALSFAGMTTAACGDGSDDGAGGAGGDGSGAAGDSCSVVDNGDGTGTIECTDGSSARITGVPGDTGEGCSAEDNGNGTWTLTCGDSDPVIVRQQAMFETKVLVQEASDLWLVVFNGTDGAAVRHRVNKPFVDGGAISYVEVSSDNAHVLYVAQDDGDAGQIQVYVSNISGDKPTAPKRVNGSLLAGAGVQTARFSPDGGKIGYLADAEVLTKYELYVAEIADGAATSNEKVSGVIAAARTVSDFVFSADGAQIAFRSNTSVATQYELYVASADEDADPVRVNGNLVTDTNVSLQYGFSPNGERLAYTANDDGAPNLLELFVAVVDGNEAETAQKVNGTLETAILANNWAFSPDSNKIAYLADEDASLVGNLNLFVADVSDDTPTNGVKADDGVAAEPVTQFGWVTSSDYLVYLSNETDPLDVELFSVDVTGATPKAPVTLSPSLAEDGAVTGFTVVPGTDNVVFWGDVRADNRTELYFVPASGEASDAVVVNHTLPSTSSATFQSIARNGAALTYASPAAQGAGLAAYRVQLGDDGPETPELVSPPTASGTPNIATALASNTGAFVALFDGFAGLSITDGIASPAYLSYTGATLYFLDD